jgi:hypothetical protein
MLSYRIVDEPQPGALQQLAVDPVWPLFAYMFGGSLLAWLWFAINGQAMGSPTRKRELLLIAIGLGGTLLLVLAVGWAFRAGWIVQRQGWIALLAVTLWKLGISYWLYSLQSRTFDLYRYFGGRAKNGIWVVIAAYFVRPGLSALLPHGLWALVVF